MPRGARSDYQFDDYLTIDCVQAAGVVAVAELAASGSEFKKVVDFFVPSFVFLHRSGYVGSECRESDNGTRTGSLQDLFRRQAFFDRGSGLLQRGILSGSPDRAGLLEHGFATGRSRRVIHRKGI